MIGGVQRSLTKDGLDPFMGSKDAARARRLRALLADPNRRLPGADRRYYQAEIEKIEANARMLAHQSAESIVFGAEKSPEGLDKLMGIVGNNPNQFGKNFGSALGAATPKGVARAAEDERALDELEESNKRYSERKRKDRKLVHDLEEQGRETERQMKDELAREKKKEADDKAKAKQEAFEQKKAIEDQRDEARMAKAAELGNQGRYQRTQLNLLGGSNLAKERDRLARDLRKQGYGREESDDLGLYIASEAASRNAKSIQGQADFMQKNNHALSRFDAIQTSTQNLIWKLNVDLDDINARLNQLGANQDQLQRQVNRQRPRG